MNKELYFFGAWHEYDKRLLNKLNKYVDTSRPPIDIRIIEYLKDENNWLHVKLGGHKCFINNEHLTRSSIISDGTWFWFSEITHYIEEHNLYPPQELIKHIVDLNFTNPNLKSEEKRLLMQEFETFGKSLPNYDKNKWKVF